MTQPASSSPPAADLTAGSPPTAGFPPRPWRIFVSLLVIGHLWAVVGRPIEFATQGPFGTSPAATTFYTPVRSYSQALYLDHGYAFFAPDPGPSHLIRATVQPPAGDTALQLTYPDHADQWPRLLYHRHFMLSEFFNNLYQPPGEPPPEIAANPTAAQQWHSARRRYSAIHDSIVRRLATQYPDRAITLQRLEHRQPGLPEFLEGGWKIDDPRLVTVMPDGTEPPDEPGVTAEVIPPSRAVSREVAP